MIGNQQKKDEFVVVGTKIPLWMAEQLNATCQVLGTTTYDIMQLFLYAFIRHATNSHDMTPEMQRLLSLLETDSGWKNAFNIANPSKMNVAQAILILEQEGRKGFGAVMIDKPWMGEARQTENASDILERIVEVTQHGVYRQIRLIGASMGCDKFADIITRMIDAQTTLDIETAFKDEMPGFDNIATNGKPYVYGHRAKRKHRRTPDGEAERQKRISFKDDDVPNLPELGDKDMDFEPFGQEW